MNGTNLIPAFHAAMELAVIQGQIAFGNFERRPVIFWMPLGVRAVARPNPKEESNP